MASARGRQGRPRSGEELLALENPLDRRRSYGHSLSRQVARLDALLLVGEGETADAEAMPFLEPRGPYFEPFALRTLGRVRGDRALIERAQALLEDMGLVWHAQQTRDLLGA